MAKIQTGLGRGLGALISDVNSIKQAAAKKPVEPARPLVSTSEIEISKIEPNPYQPRTEFNQEALEELAASIKLLGLIQPITLRPLANGRYQIISGERRFRASQIAGLERVPAYIRQTDDQGMLEMAIVENIQREDLDSIEVALSFQRLIEECNLTQEAMAERVGKKRTTVTNYLRLLKLPAKIQHDLKVGLLSVGHAKVLLGIDDVRLQEYLCDLVIKDDMSVRQLEDKIKKLSEPKKASEDNGQELPDEYFKVLEIVGRYFENNISLKRSSGGKGSMTIHFNSDEEIRKFLKAIEKCAEE